MQRLLLTFTLILVTAATSVSAQEKKTRDQKVREDREKVTSEGFWMNGRGFSSQLMAFGPWYTKAFTIGTPCGQIHRGFRTNRIPLILTRGYVQNHGVYTQTD